ncbi:carbohydrate ABC transporter permease [Bailinhaonella thermotolerans]|uniref:Sugar ABC transporter permease n=1 Tax=Bailinhaonella thermotolerans TaxID=1070861 RepID=A0A3A4AKA1_9ACTN|nr:sugar ABC transporter permease [Bailinhaonella thermotolerans]RJL21446.1 sugar ABC transporter permease [Bailinhaonella thermotolerans]
MRRAAWGFLTPFLALFALFFVLPLGYALVRSLYAVRRPGLGFGPASVEFAALRNYAAVLADPVFRSALGRIAVLGLVQIPVMLGLAAVLALLLDAGLARAVRWFRLGFFLPYGVPGVIAVLLWANLYVPQVFPLAWTDLLAPPYVLAAIGNIVTWEYVGYNTLILVTALQAVPRSLIEAAAADGAGPWRTAWSVKLPLLRPALVLTATFSIIGTLQLFSEPAVLRTITPAVSAGYTPNLHVYNTIFTDDLPHLGAAQAVLLAAVTFALSIAFLRVTRRWSAA